MSIQNEGGCTLKTPTSSMHAALIISQRSSLLILIAIAFILPFGFTQTRALKPAFAEALPQLNRKTDYEDTITLANSFVEAGHVIGISYSVWHKGEQVLATHHGLAKLSDKTPISDETIFRIYSMTKPITAVAMMILYERGVWAWDDPIAKHLPELSQIKIIKRIEQSMPVLVPPKTPPTMRHLMTHMAGFAYGLSDINPVDKYYRRKRILESQTNLAVINKVGAAPLLFEPGTQWYYSIASDIQGAMIERWTGMSLGAFMQAEIFGPLGMEDTGFYVSNDTEHRLSDIFGYVIGTQNLVRVDDWLERFTPQSVSRHKGGGGLVSTTKDYALFLKFLAQINTVSDKQILSDDSIKTIMTPHLGDGMGLWSQTHPDRLASPGHNYGLGVGIVTDPEQADLPFGTGTIYWSGIAGTWFWLDPINDVFGIGMTQRYDSPFIKGPDIPTLLSHQVYQDLERQRIKRSKANINRPIHDENGALD